MDLKINHLQHIGLPITDIKTSEIFYGRLGFENVMQRTFAYQGGEGQVSMMRLDKIVIELYQMPEPELSNVRQRSNGRIDHIAFDVTDIDMTFELLKSEGFNIIEENPVFLNFWDRGCKYFNITGPDGERLEFCQIL